MDERSAAEQDSQEHSLEDTLQDQIQLAYYIAMVTGIFRYLHSLLCLYPFINRNYVILFHIYFQRSSFCL